MKIEIDLKDILHDEDYGSESVQDSIRRQVVEKLTKTMSEGITKKIDSEISKAINDQIRLAIDEIRPSLIENLLDAEYMQVDRWGDRQNKPTTFRKELVKAINEQMVYQKSNNSYDKNSFTKSVDEAVANQTDLFKKEFNKIVDANYVAQTKEFAIKTIREKLGF